ncbi:MAG: glycoside hydrolase family 16 protein [Devosia sp.]
MLAPRSAARWAATLLAGFLLVASSARTLADPPASGAPWNTVFSDEFSGPELDLTKWTLCYWWNDGGCTNKGNHELQWYVPEGVSVVDGNLVLTASRQNTEDNQGNTYAFSSGMVTSGFDGDPGAGTDRFSFTYGYVEVRAKLPKGKGVWPAIWLLPSTHKSLPEIDMAEVLGDTPELLRLHYHYANGTNSESIGKNITTPDLSLDWHVYGMDWEKDAIVWYLDGIEQWRYTDTASISHEPMYLLMNLAVGGDWPGAPDQDTVFPTSMLVDYVRVSKAVPR